MPLNNAEKHYFQALLLEEIDTFSRRAADAQAAVDKVEVKGSPYHLAQLGNVSYNRGMVQGLRAANELLKRAQT